MAKYGNRLRDTATSQHIIEEVQLSTLDGLRLGNSTLQANRNAVVMGDDAYKGT